MDAAERKPVAAIHRGPQESPALLNPVGVAFEPNDAHLWVADVGTNTVYSIDPETCAMVDTITVGTNNSSFVDLEGVAVSPAAF